jgi:hypothetical protein
LIEECAAAVHSVGAVNVMIKKLVMLAALLAVGMSVTPAEADPVGDFFKRLGRSITNPQPRKQPDRRSAKPPSKRAVTGSPSPSPSPSPSLSLSPVPATSPSPSSTPRQVIERRALAAPRGEGNARDLPYGVPVPGRPGFVTSPYAPTRGQVDVREFASGAEVEDPFTGKVFLAP